MLVNPDTLIVATPRNQLVDAEQALFYHIVSRCVRRAWLCGFDRESRKDYSHRKNWMIERLTRLGQSFAVDIYAYAIMSNHFHLVVYYDPKAAENWTDEEIADRWLSISPPKHADGRVDTELLELKRAAILEDNELINTLRLKLGSLSLFMKLLKQPIARRANQEDEVTGHFFEQRFYSSPLLSEAAIKSAMAYVDLNPIRAKVSESIENSKHTSIYHRLKTYNPSDALSEYLGPVIAGISNQPRIRISLSEYVDHLEAWSTQEKKNWTEEKLKRWRAQIDNIAKYQRVHGSEINIAQWIQSRGWRRRELAMPS